ncbi:flagellar basal body P-ring formation chaperone FlgA [Gilliamella sp. Choc6-1]|uniref:flagellar basal body P-ring formation chaperone FlgA n=1 Tax=Gilliamella sp. Choc6-1 TaxID=3120239 RepID=UPI00080ED69E|nr:flagellar basal body P-ring formation chaperone FlgA [Gilliamella apicola]
MIIIVRLILLIILLFSANIAVADSLEDEVNKLISKHINYQFDNIVITYTSPKPELTCIEPKLALINKKKKWGLMTISAKCGKKTQYFHINVAVEGGYVVANQAIGAGKVITPEHLKIQIGRLDTLPFAVILDKEQVINHIALRNIDLDEPIRTSMLQKNWQVKAGQNVNVIINGQGYQIMASGKILNNAVLEDNVSVKLHSGKIVEGKLTCQGVIIFDK